jgi:hypothetical protein
VLCWRPRSKKGHKKKKGKRGKKGQTVDWNSSCAHGSSARAGFCWCCSRPERWSTDLAPLAVPTCTRAAIHLTGKDGNVLPAVPTIHHVIDRARIFHSHGARHGAMRVGITAPGQAQNTIEKEPQTASLSRICWDQSTVDPLNLLFSGAA